MNQVIRYLDINIINSKYCKILKLPFNSFYVRTDYSSYISIHSAKYNFYDELQKGTRPKPLNIPIVKQWNLIESSESVLDTTSLNLMDDFKCDITHIFKKLSNDDISSVNLTKVDESTKINFVLIKPLQVTKYDLYPTYSSKYDPIGGINQVLEQIILLIETNYLLGDFEHTCSKSVRGCPEPNYLSGDFESKSVRTSPEPTLVMNELKPILKVDDLLSNINCHPDKIEIIDNDFKQMIFRFDEYLIKVRGENSEDLVHPAFINYILNKYVKLPNFSEFICLSEVSFDLIIPELQFDPIHCLVTGYIESEVLSYEQISDVSDLKNILKQIIYSIYEAHKILKFTHYDLHNKNILIQSLDKNILIKYLNAGEEVTTDKLVIIIDLEFSHIQLDTTQKEDTDILDSINEYCKYSEYNFGLLQHSINIFNTDFWVHDIFKILLSMFNIIKFEHIKPLTGKGNLQSLELIKSLLKFFVLDEMNHHLYNQLRMANTTLNLRCLNSNLKFDDFIDFFRLQVN